MRCAYINLETAEERQRSIEASFAAAAPAGLRLARFSALTPADVAHVPGSLSGAEKACFRSHTALIGADLDTADPLYVLEDDAVFSPQTFAVLDRLLASSPEEWDILFTDVGFWDPGDLVELAKQRDGLAEANKYRLLNLARSQFFGATAYVVRGSSKARMHQALEEATTLDVPYDLYLRRLAHGGRLRMAACFPFLTTVAHPAVAKSQIQPGDQAFFDLTVNAFRRLMWVNRDLADCRQATDQLLAGCDETSRMVGAVCAAITSVALPEGR